jgi:hypothetical protein
LDELRLRFFRVAVSESEPESESELDPEAELSGSAVASQADAVNAGNFKPINQPIRQREE